MGGGVFIFALAPSGKNSELNRRAGGGHLGLTWKCSHVVTRLGVTELGIW